MSISEIRGQYFIMEVKFIKGGLHQDERGTVSFVNDFDLSKVKRFYIIENSSPAIVRAWQGHKLESKYFYAVKGKILICTVKIDDWDNPSKDLTLEEYILDENKPGVLHVPGGYVNGIKSIKPDSKLIVFSEFGLEDGKKDDYRYDKNRWYNWENGVH